MARHRGRQLRTGPHRGGLPPPVAFLPSACRRRDHPPPWLLGLVSGGSTSSCSPSTWWPGDASLVALPRSGELGVGGSTSSAVLVAPVASSTPPRALHPDRRWRVRHSTRPIGARCASPPPALAPIAALAVAPTPEAGPARSHRAAAGGQGREVRGGAQRSCPRLPTADLSDTTSKAAGCSAQRACARCGRTTRASPRGRGTALLLPGPAGGGRNIPAWAGNRLQPHSSDSDQVSASKGLAVTSASPRQVPAGRHVTPSRW